MTTDGGGWTIVFAQQQHSNGVCHVRMTDDAEALSDDPLSFGIYNVNRQKKVDLAATAAESIFVRNSGSWIKTDRPIFQTLLSQTHSEYSVTVTESSGAITTGVEMGYSTGGISYGGDFGITSSGTLDHHNGGYYNLNSGCVRHYIYQFGSSGYDVNTGTGSWSSTSGCSSSCSASFGFYAAVR